MIGIGWRNPNKAERFIPPHQNELDDSPVLLWKTSTLITCSAEKPSNSFDNENLTFNVCQLIEWITIVKQIKYLWILRCLNTMRRLKTPPQTMENPVFTWSMRNTSFGWKLEKNLLQRNITTALGALNYGHLRQHWLPLWFWGLYQSVLVWSSVVLIMAAAWIFPLKQ